MGHKKDHLFTYANVIARFLVGKFLNMLSLKKSVNIMFSLASLETIKFEENVLKLNFIVTKINCIII